VGVGIVNDKFGVLYDSTVYTLLFQPGGPILEIVEQSFIVRLLLLARNVNVLNPNLPVAPVIPVSPFIPVEPVDPDFPDKPV
jgi:hypothetical protein